MTNTQKAQLVAAVITFIVALCNILGLDIPVVPTV